MFDRDSKLIWEQYSNVLLESKQSIINLGYPRSIADIFFERYGKNSFVAAKWMKDALTNNADNKDWWYYTFRQISSSNKDHGLDLVDLVKLYDAAKIGEQEYIKTREEIELPISEEGLANLDLDEDIKYLYKTMKEKLFNRFPFNSSIMRGLDNGTINNIKEYSKLSFEEANQKYNSKRIFQDTTPIKSYKNGYKWIDVGEKCELVGKSMKNCGSTGVMSRDKDRTMLVLFDRNNTPHVVLTYSPNENRISGIEGQASTPTKEEYHEYVLDIANHLKADIDYHRESSKSKMLATKSMLKPKLKNITTVYSDDTDECFLVTMDDNKQYYSNYNYFIPAEEITSTNPEEVKKTLKDIFLKAYRGNQTPAINNPEFLRMYNIPIYSPKY